MKRFLVFSNIGYETSGGGWRDFDTSYGTLEEAIAAIKSRAEEVEGGWWHVVDIETQSIVYEK